MTSIRGNLMVWLLGGLGLTLACATGAVYLVARDEARELFDYHLQRVAASLPGQAFSVIEPVAAPGDELPEESVVIQIWDRNGTQLYFSHPSSHLPQRAELGFATVDTQHGPWRVYSSLVGNNIVQVAQPLSVRRELAADIALRTALPLLILFPVFGAAILFTVRRGLRPLTRIAGDVQARSAAMLAPVSQTGVPDEIKPLADALNNLLLRLGDSLETQRAFVADAAHELHSPLTALKLQIQLAERAGTSETRAVAFTRLRAGLERSIHLVAQLLALARLEPGAGSAGWQALDLSGVARMVVSERAAAARGKQIGLGLPHADQAALDGDVEAMRVLLGNLVDNAIRYTPAGGTVDVEVRNDGGSITLQVADSGPGIPAADRARVFDRFYRLPGAPSQGSGLGLAIVKSIVERHGAAIELGDRPGGGLLVTVRFQALPAASAGAAA